MAAPNVPTSLAVTESAVLQWFGGQGDPYPASLSAPGDHLSNKAAVLLTWTDTNSGAAQVRVEKSVNAGTSWSLAGIASPGATSLLVGDLALSAAHLFRARAEADGASSFTSNVSHTTPALAASSADAGLTAPTGLAVSNITNRGFTLTWEDTSTNEAGFAVHFRVSDYPGDITYYVRGTTESVTILDEDGSRAGQTLTAFVTAVGGKATAAGLPPYSSVASNTVTWQMLAQKVSITGPDSTTLAEKGAAFSMRIATNVPVVNGGGDAFSITDGALPTGLSIDAETGVISGTPSVVGAETFEVTADDGTTSDAMEFTIDVRESHLVIFSRGVATAPLGQVFSYTILARNMIATGAPPTTFGALNLPDWLTRTDAIVGGTPTVAGVFVVTLTASNSTSTTARTLTITVPAISVTGDDELDAYVGQELSIGLTASVPGATFSISDGPEWLTLDGATLSGTPTETGDVTVDVTATLNEESASRTLTIHVSPLLVVVDEITGWQGDPLLANVRYAGAGAVKRWHITGGPAGVTISSEGVSSSTLDFATVLEGIPSQAGIFTATVSVVVKIGSQLFLYSTPVEFRINGELFLEWLHDDPSIYDLQVNLRGDASARTVRSYYATSAVPGSTAVETVANGPVSTVTTTPNVGRAANVLTLKRGDTAKLGILIRDGRAVLTEGLESVRFTLRLPDAPDAAYVIDEAATPIEIEGGGTYNRVLIDITASLLEDLTQDDSITSVSLIGEITWTYNSDYAYSSASFPVTIVEDVER